MRRIILACIAAVLLFSTAAQAREWYEGGTLHRATVAQYLQGDPADVLATTSDWVSATIADAEINALNMNDIKKASVDVAMCVVKATDGVPAVQQQRASQMAVLCMSQLKNRYRWLLTK